MCAFDPREFIVIEMSQTPVIRVAVPPPVVQVTRMVETAFRCPDHEGDTEVVGSQRIDRKQCGRCKRIPDHTGSILKNECLAGFR